MPLHLTQGHTCNSIYVIWFCILRKHSVSFGDTENAFTLESIMLCGFSKSVAFGLIDLLLKSCDLEYFKIIKLILSLSLALFQKRFPYFLVYFGSLFIASLQFDLRLNAFR